MQPTVSVIRFDGTHWISRGLLSLIFLCIYFFLLAILPGSGIAAPLENLDEGNKVLTFATPDSESVFTHYLNEVFREMGHRAGISCRIVELPKKRCLKDTDKGFYNGVAARVAGLTSTEYKNLVQLHTPIYTVEHIVFLNRDDAPGIRTLEDLVQTTRAHNLLVAYMCGSVKACSLLADLPEKNTICLESPEQAFRMLSSKRIYAFLSGPGVVGKAALRQLQEHSPKNERLQCIVPGCIVSSTPLFPYVHTTYKDVIPVLDKALSSMEADGTLKRLQNTMQ